MVDNSKKVLSKVILLGDMGVGKTSLLTSISQNPSYKKPSATAPAATVAVDFRNIYMTVGQFTVNLQVWDTAGQE